MVVAATLLVALLVACEEDRSSKANAVPPGAVAAVGDDAVTRQELRERTAAMRRAQPRDSKLPDTQLREHALARLLRSAALEQEAARRGIEVGERDLRARWRSVVKAQFQTPRALRRFLGRRTTADVLYDLRLQTLTEAIHDDVRSNAEGDGDEAVSRFREDFDSRWRADTTCRRNYDLPACRE